MDGRNLWSIYPDAPWCWNIYLQNLAICGVNVGTYSSTMVRIWDMENQWERYGFMETYVENLYLVGGLEHCFIFP